MICGEPIPYFFVLQNDDYGVFTSVSVKLFSSFSYVEKLPEDKEYELLPGDKYKFETALICKYRGEYEVGVKEVVITDFLRLFRLRYRIPSTIRALVLPRIVRVEELKSLTDLTSLLQREALHVDVEPDVVVRDYVPGDLKKQIHWRATAKEQKLKVRTRIGEEKQGILLLCDTKRYSFEQREYLPVENKLLEVFLALGIFLAEKNVSYDAYYKQNSLVKHHVRAIEDFDSFYKNVSEISFDVNENFEKLLEDVRRQGAFVRSRVVFFVLHELNAAIMEFTEELSAAGVLVIIYVVTEENMDFYIKQGNERRRIVAISTEAELEGGL